MLTAADKPMGFESLLAAITALPPNWHGSGSFRPDVLARLASRLSGRSLHHTAETGTGKSTLLLSHLSEHHVVFAKDDAGDGDSLMRTRGSDLLQSDRVEFVVGPTQRTLPVHQFASALQFALIDGPHGYPFPELEYYYLYPHLESGALLVVDDINIPTVYHLFEVLREDPMFELLEVAHTTAVFQRTAAPTFDPLGDGWWDQAWNKRRFPVQTAEMNLDFGARLRAAVPLSWKQIIRRVLR